MTGFLESLLDYALAAAAALFTALGLRLRSARALTSVIPIVSPEQNGNQKMLPEVMQNRDFSHFENDPRDMKMASFLQDALDDHELRSLVKIHAGSEAADKLPGKEVAHAYLAEKSVEILERRRAIDREFFSRLRALRGRRRAEILRLEKLWFSD